MKNGAVVAEFEREFAQYVGGKYAIACANGTVTLQAALVALGVAPGDRVAVPPLTMSATAMAVLNVGAVPVFVDVNEWTWILSLSGLRGQAPPDYLMPVSLYGLHQQQRSRNIIDDAAQTLRPHSGTAFTSYSFQASKILSTGEGGMLVTNDEALAAHARSYLSLGYDLRPDQPRIDPATIKRSDTVRHVRGGINGRMNDVTARLGLEQLEKADALKQSRQIAASFYRDAIADYERWVTPQVVPDGWHHDYWAFAVACESELLARQIQGRMVEEGAEMPYGAWRLTYQEPAFKHLVETSSYEVGSGRDIEPAFTCPVAESLQPRLLQFQTNTLADAARNADALRRVLRHIL